MHRIIHQGTAAISLLLVLSFAVLLACMPPLGSDACGDGTVQEGEECDSDDSSVCYDCELVECGDGDEEGDEECDDGNEDDEDSCRNDCELPECVLDTDCTVPGEICLHTHCLSGCRDNADCAATPPPGEICDITTCVPKPSSDADCAADEIYDLSTGACVKGCRSDAACQAATGFADRICTASITGTDVTEAPCTCASDCSGSKTCNGHCAITFYSASSSVCLQGCRSAAQCAPGQVCNAYNECADPCTTDADCCAADFGNSGATCNGGVCKDACTESFECARGTICDGSFCIAGCQSDSDCDAGTMCNAGSCVAAGCGDGSKCVFLTAAQFSPELGGALGADDVCQATANAGASGLQGRPFKAWISDSTTSPATRFTQAAVPYKLLDGTTIANNWADLTDGMLASLIRIDELGNVRMQSGWTNTLSSGAANNVSGVPGFDSCENWTSALGETGRGGDAGTFTDLNWTEGGTYACGTTRALYCFQQ